MFSNFNSLERKKLILVESPPWRVSKYESTKLTSDSSDEVGGVGYSQQLNTPSVRRLRQPARAALVSCTFTCSLIQGKDKPLLWRNPLLGGVPDEVGGVGCFSRAKTPSVRRLRQPARAALVSFTLTCSLIRGKDKPGIPFS